jgi:alpha-L-rhamnosidase
MNWNLWMILQIEEYARDRGGDPALVGDLKKIVYGILGAMQRLENEFGLAEDMPGWVFVEWSRANDADVVCGVNFPTNMLYCGAMEAAGRTYNDPALIEKAVKLRETIRKMSFNGKYFVDNAIRKDGKLVLTDNTTEVCQDYAFYFDIASEELHPELWDTFTHQFGPHRKDSNSCPDVPFANAFIGNYLRLEILMREGLYDQLLEEIIGFFDIMAVTTGSLWEHVTTIASCCHGFASHTAVWLLKLYDKLNLGA